MHVVITGASSGIGNCLAREYHSAGARVTVVARRAALLEQLKDELKERCEVVVADLSDHHPTGWVKSLGPIDIFINNAGFNITGAFDAAAVRGLRQSGDRIGSGNLDRRLVARD